MAIRSFKDAATKEFFLKGVRPKKKGWDQARGIARRKLDMLHYAKELKDLRSPPGNNLEALKGDLKGFYSIRINDQWHLVFSWKGAPDDVHIIDYH